MTWVLKIKNKLIVFLGGYTREEIKHIFFVGVKDGSNAHKPIDFDSNYYNPEEVIKQYDKSRSNRNC